MQPALPFSPGAEIAGTITALGAEVQGLKVGTPVAALCGIGGFAEECVADAALVMPLPPGVGINHRFPHFQHLFYGSGYAAGYYVYLWAEVLDADAFQAFVEAGSPFDPQVAERLRRHVYAAGDSVEPAAT